QHGGSFVWCDEAFVVDVVPPERVTRRWVLQRAVRSGNTASRAALHVTRSRPARLRVRAAMGARGLLRLGGGAVRLTAGILSRDASRQARGARTAARGLGMLLGAAGGTFSEYKRSRPTSVDPSSDRRASMSPSASAMSVTEP
ncbi:MAG: glycosyl transferase family 2, partial [Actinotalea sp.]|nr:glycosyl transferase family 2 [Actinotalea sp.]